MIESSLLLLLSDFAPAAASDLQAAQPGSASLPELFSMGSPFLMSVLTILLVGLFFAAWKAPAWVKEIGLAAPIVASLSVLFGLYNVFDTLQHAPDISPLIVYAGVKCAVIPMIYSLLIYLISLVIRIIRKPRI